MGRLYTVPQVLPSVNELYQHSATGCCLHIVLDDYNVDDNDVQFCLKVADEKLHLDCFMLGFILLSMSKTQHEMTPNIKTLILY